MSFPPPLPSFPLSPLSPLPLTHALNSSPTAPSFFTFNFPSSPVTTSVSTSTTLNSIPSPPSTTSAHTWTSLPSIQDIENGPRIKRKRNNESPYDNVSHSSTLPTLDYVAINQTITKINHCVASLISGWERKNKSGFIADLISLRRNSSRYLNNQETQKLDKLIDGFFAKRKAASQGQNKISLETYESLIDGLKDNLTSIKHFLPFDQFHSIFLKLCQNQQADLANLMWMNNLSPEFSVAQVEELIKCLVFIKPSSVIAMLRSYASLKQISDATAIILYKHAFRFIDKEYLQFLMANIGHMDAIDSDGNNPVQLSIINGGFFTAQIVYFFFPPTYLPLQLSREDSPPFRDAVTAVSFGEWEVDKLPKMSSEENAKLGGEGENFSLDNYSELHLFFSQQQHTPIKPPQEGGSQYSLEQRRVLKHVNNEGKTAFELALENPKLFGVFNTLSSDFDLNLDFAQYTKLLVKYTTLETLDRLEFLLNKISDKDPHLKTHEIIINLILWHLPAENFKKNDLLKIIEWFESKGYLLTALSYQSLISLSLERESPFLLDYLIKKSIVKSSNINNPIARFGHRTFIEALLSRISEDMSLSISDMIDLIIPLGPNFQDAILKIFFNSILQQFLKINEILLIKNINCNLIRETTDPNLLKLSLLNYLILTHPADIDQKMEWLVDEGFDIDCSMDQAMKLDSPISWKLMQYYISHNLTYEASQCDNQFSDQGLPLLLHFIRTSQWDKLYYFIQIGCETHAVDEQGRGLFTYLIQNASFDLENHFKRLQSFSRIIDVDSRDIANAILLLDQLKDAPGFKNRYPYQYSFILIRKYILNSNVRLSQPLAQESFQKSAYAEQCNAFFKRDWENIAFTPLISHSNLGYHNTISESDKKQIESTDPFLELERLWRSIDFSKFEFPMNRETNTHYNEKELKEKIDTILQAIKDRSPLRGTPPSTRPELLNQFYDQILFKLKAILFSFRKQDENQISSQISYNQEQINSFFLNLFEASFYCPGGWLGYLQMMYTLLNGGNLDVPTQFRTLTTQFRHHIAHFWSIKHAPEDKQLHLYLALLQKHGFDRLGIPDAKNIIDHLGYLPPLLEALFLGYDFDFENSPSKIIDFMEQQIHFPPPMIKDHFDKFFVADYMKAHFVGNWKKEEFELKFISLSNIIENRLREHFAVNDIINELKSDAEKNEINVFPFLPGLNRTLSSTESNSNTLQKVKTILFKAVQQSREDAFIAAGMIYEENNTRILRIRIIQLLLDFGILVKTPQIDWKIGINAVS